MPIPPDAQKKSDQAFTALQKAVTEVIDRKRKLGQYWVVWDGEKPVEVHPDGVHPETDEPAAAE